MRFARDRFGFMVRAKFAQSGLIWSGLIWSGLIWSGLIWSGLMRPGLIHQVQPGPNRRAKAKRLESPTMDLF